MKILGIIPARSGSKGVPKKNSRMLGNMSLVERTFKIAQESGVLDRIIVSTDDFEVMATAQRIGLEVPFVRPPHLCTDEAPMIEVVNHALAHLDSEGYSPQAVMLLQPTSPLRTVNHLQLATALLGNNDSVVSVVALPKTHCPHYVMKIEDGYLTPFMESGEKITRRQDAPQAYVREGTVYLTRRSVLTEQRSFYGKKCFAMEIPESESLSIDTPEDWKRAAQSLKVAA